MIEPKKSNRTYGADPLLRAASLEKEFNSKVRTPEQQKALAQLRRENLDTSITKYNEAVNLLSKDKITPTTDYQKRLANGLKAQGILAQSDAQANQKVSEEHTQRLQKDVSTLSEGFFGPILNYGKGLFEPRIKATYKKYTDGSGQSAEVYSDAGKHYKKVGNKVQLASAKDIQESGMFKDFEATASDMHNSDSYYAGRASRGAIHGAWSEFTNNALGSALTSIVRAGAQLGSVGSKTLDGKYNSISEALGDLDKTGMNSFNMMGVGALNLWMKASLAADKATFNNKEDQANYAKSIAEYDIRMKQLKKEQEDWIKSEVGERAAQMKKGNTKQTLSGKLLEASLSLDKVLDDSRAEEQITKDINSALSQRAQDLRGVAAGTFAQKNKQINQEQVFDSVTNKKYAREKVDDSQKMSDGKASAWDVKEIVLDENGNVTLDSNRQPVYKDKFSVWQSLSSSDTTAFSDKYFMGDTLLQEGVESLADIASTVILSKGLGAVAKGASLTGKGISALVPNVVPKTLSAVNKATLGKSMKYIDNMLGKVDSGLTNLGNKSKIGTKMVSNFKPKSVLDASDFAGVSTVRAAKLKTLARNMTLAYLEGGGESDQIAFDVKTKILEEKVDKLANISTEDIAQEIMQTDSSVSPEQAFYLAGKEADRLRGEWAVANEDAFNEVQAYAAVGQEVARATNNLGFITNLGQVTAVLKNKTFSSTLHKNGYDAINPWRPIKEIMSKDYIKGIKRILPGEAAKQGLIEGLLEEGFLNTSAERAGLAAGKGEGYALLDILDNIDSEFVESVYAGAIIGAGQSKASSVYQGFSGRREYKAQQAEITKILNRTPETKAQLKDFFNTSIEAEHVKKTLDDIDELSRTTKTVNGAQVQKTKGELAEDKSKVADLQEQMFITNAITMASKGLSGKLGESIESAMTAEGLEAEDIAQLQTALDFNKYIAASFDRFAATEGYDPITLTLNRAKRKLMMDQTTTAEANISARKQSIESAIAERKLDRIEQYAEDTTETSDKAAELLDTYMAMSADQSEAFLNDTTDKELLELDATLNSVPKAMREAIKTLDDVYSALQEEYSKPFSNNQRLATLNYIEHKEFKDALFNATTEDEIEQMIQGNFDVAFSERELELAERAKANIKAQALAESIPKQVTKQAVEEFHSPEAVKLREEQAQQAQDEIDEYLNSGRTTTPLNTPAITTPERLATKEKSKLPTKQQSPTPSPRTTGEIQMGDYVGGMGGYPVGTAIAVTDIHSGGETVKEAIAQGVNVQLTSIFITDAGEILASVSIGDEVSTVRLKGKVSESQEKGRVTYQMELGDDVTDSVEFELMETVDLLELETKYGVPVLSTLPDENGNATMFYQFGPNVKIKLRLPDTDLKLEDDLQKLAEEYFGLEVGDVKPLGEIMAPGAFPDGMTADTEVEVISITHPLEAVQVMDSVTFATAYVEAMPASDMDLDESLRNVSKPAENTEASNRIRTYMTQAAQEMDKVLGRPATFEDYLDSRVEALGEQSVFDDYSKYAAMWAYTGRATENIHDTYFSTDMLMEDIKTKYFHFADEEEYAEEVVGSVGEVITARKKKDIQESEPEVEPVTEGLTDAEIAELEGEFKSEFYDRVFEDHRQTSASNTPGNLGLTYQTDVETGEIVRDLGLASSPFMNNSNWLSPNNIKVGDKLTVKAPVLGEVLDVPVTDWVQNEFGTWVLNPEYITFGELMAREGFVEGSPEYIRRVPMKAYTADGKEAFWIRDMAWINPSNYNSSIDVRATVTSVRAKNLSIRTNTVLNNGTEITVTKRDLGSVTTFTKLTDTGKTKDTEFNTDPTSLLATAINQNTLYVDGKRVEVNSPESGINIVNNIVYSGAPYALRHVSTEIVNGKEVKNYLAVMLHTNLPQQGESINQSIRNTVKFGVVASYYNHVAKAVKAGTIDGSALLSLQERFNLSGEQIKEITEAINSTYNVDINSYSGKQSGGLASFINKFVSFSEGSKGREGDYYEVLTSVDDAKRPDGQAYGYVQKGQIGFNIKGQTTEAKQTGIDDYGGRVNTTVTLNPNKMSAAGIETTASMIEQMFSTGGSFSKMRFDADPRHLGQDNKTVIIDQDGNVTSTDTSYSDFVKQNVYTNVAAFRLSDTEYVTDIQPAINFEESSDSITPELSNMVTPGLVPTPETPVAPVITPEARKVFNGLEDELANLPDEVKGILGDVSFVGLERDIYAQPTDLDESLRNLTAEQSQSLSSIKSNSIEGLDPVQQKIVVEGLYDSILKQLHRADKYDLSNLQSLIAKAPNVYLQPELTTSEEALSLIKLSLLEDTYPTVVRALEIKVEKLNAVLNNQAKLTNVDSVTPGDLVVKFQKFFQEEFDDTEGTEQSMTDSTGEVDESYDKDLLTKEIVTSFSTELQVFFSGIPKFDRFNKSQKTFFTGIKEHEDSKNIIGALRSVMVDTESSADDLQAKLLEKSLTNPVYKEIYNKFIMSPDKVKNEILYKMIQDRLTMKSIMINRGVDFETTILDPNSNEASIMHRVDWSANLVHQENLTDTNEDGTISYNKEKVDAAIENFKEVGTLIRDLFSSKEGKELAKAISKKEEFTIPEEIMTKTRELVKSLGVGISDIAFEEFMYKNIMNLNTKNEAGLVLMPLRSLNKISAALSTPGTEVLYTEKDYNLFQDISGVIKGLSNAQVAAEGNPITKSFRSGGKNYQGTIQKTMISKLVSKLRDTSSKYFRDLSIIPYSKGNYLLGALLNDPKIRSKFSIDYLGPEALIKEGIKYGSESRKINMLPEADNILTELGMFSETASTTDFKVDSKPGIRFRMARMFSPTLSDKSQMVTYTMPVVDLRANNYNLETGEVSTDVLDFLREQIFDAELERIISVLRHRPNIKGYKAAGAYFSSIPAFNAMTIETVTGESITEVNILDYLVVAAKDPSFDLSKAKALFSDNAQAVLTEVIAEEVANKLKTWARLGIATPGGRSNVSKKYLETKNFTMETPAEVTENAPKVLAVDYVINNLLNQNNTYQLVLGDIAQFAKGKPAPMVEEDVATGLTDDNGKPITKKVRRVSLEGLISLVKMTGESVTKRAAMLIAPGSELANSKNDVYTQIMINDAIRSVSVAKGLIKQYYGEVSLLNELVLNRLDSAEVELSELLRSERSLEDKTGSPRLELDKEIEGLKGKLKKLNPELAGYFEIEGTDAQEYTTWKEHLDIILRQGRLDKADHAKIMSAYKKLEAGEDINSEELRVVMNPIKPVYAGPLTEYGKDENGATDLNNPIAMRTVYIKSSSFPLLPQLTKGLDLDRTRDIMEKLSVAKGTNVRLSYETANKVGHTPTDLTVEDLYNLSFEDLYSIDENGVARGRLANSILDLDREFFKVQQDTPYKSAKFLKKGTDDMVTMGSQMWKLLMGNNINKGDKFIFPITFDPNLLSVLQERGITIPTKGGMITGQGLDLVKTFIESEYFDNQKTILFSELGLSADGQVVDPSETRKALKEIIQNELATGAYPAYANDEVVLDDVDNLELDFRVPLWMTSNANKLETLLQGIITSRMIKIKLPGYQHISTSSEGFVKSFESLDNSIKSSIVWVDPNHSGQLKSTVTVDGEVSFSEVLIQSKMRTRVPVLDKDGKPVMGKNDKPKTEFKMIDLTQAPYATRNERGDLILDMEMMDPALVEMFSFRIPTSSHQSGAMLKVVGFLPEASGDMLVVPKEHTVQIGEDYDIDKRNVYKNHYTVDKSGKIRKLSGKRFLEPIDAKEFQSAEFRFQQRKIQRQLNAESAYVDYAVLEDELSILLELEAEMFPELSETSVTPFTQDIEKISQELEDKFEVLEQETIVSFRNDRLTVQEKLDKGREKYKVIAGKTYGRLKGNIRMNASQKAKTTFYEDSMVNIYKSVFMTPDRDIQNKIGKILSFDIATTTAEAIQGKLSVGSSPYFTTYSDEYQRNQQKLGAAGKVGIGQHSNAVTFQSQMERLADKINLNRVITLGNLKSTGVLGSTTTIDGYRDIADVHTENQNSATDNVKAQIMGKRNENAYTMGVLSMMTFRGFDLDTVDATTMDGKKRLQVPSLFISQPALRNYVDAMDASKSALQAEKTPATTVMAEVYYSYMSKLTDKQAQELFTVGKSVKYIKDALREGKSIFKPGVLESLSTGLTSQTLYDNLTNEEANRNPLLQLAVLENFNILSAENDKLNKYQKLINMNTSGLGLSYFEVLDRKEVLNELLLEEDFLNVVGLISDSILVEGDLVGGEDLTGYIKIGYTYIRPSTTEGVVLLNSIVAAESTMGTVFPYESRGIQYLYKKLRSVDSFGFKKTRFEMMRAFKDFLLSSPDAGFFDGTVKEERDRLLQDTPGKQSLAAFLKSMHQSRNDLSLTNDLLKDFRYNQVTAYGVSFINHKADGKSPSDKMDKHRAFLELLQDDYTDLGEWNGETMTPRTLALNLYNYSMLTKDDQGFQGFREFMPADMQEIYGTDKYLQNINRNLDSSDTEMLDRFFTQFIQHNPDLVNSYSTSNFTSLYESDSLDNIVYKGGRNLDNQLENLENLKSRDMPLGPAVKNLLAYSDSFETVYYANFSEFVAFSVWDVDPSDPTGSSTISENVLFKAERVSEHKIRYTRLRKLGNGKVRVDYDANGDVGDLTFTPGPDVQERVLEANRIALNDSAGALIVDGEVMTVNQILGESKNGKEVLGKVIELTPDTAELKGLLLTIYNALDENLAPKIELIDDYVGDKFISHGAYSSETNTIYINSNLGAYIAQEDGMSTLEVLGDLLGEEFLHSMQIRSLSEHVGFNADGSHYLYSEFNTPAHVLSIVKMFDDALTAGVEHPAMKNLKEFVAAVYTRSDFRAELDAKTIGWREKFLRVIRAVVRDFTGDVSFSGKLREDIDKLMGDAWNIQDTLAKTSDEPGFIPNGIKLTYGLPGVTPLTSPRTSDPTNLVNKTGFTMYETERALRTLLSGKPIKLMSKAARAAAKNPRLAQAQSQLVRDIIDQVGKLKNTTIKPENVSDYFTLTETGGVLEIQYTPKEVKVTIPKKEVKQVKEEAPDTKVSEEVTTGDTVTYKGEEFLVRGFAKNGNVNLALLDGTPKKGGAVKLSNVTKVSGVTPEAKVAASEPTPQSEVGSMSEYTDVSGQASLDFSLRNKLPKVKNCM